MANRNQLFLISGTSSASASTTTVIGGADYCIHGLERFDWFTFVGIFIGGANTAGDIAWVQMRLDKDTDVWVDWLRFPSIATGGTTYKWIATTGASASITATGTGTAASPGTVTLAANTFIGGHPGDCIRLVYTTGGSTTAGAAQKLYIKGWKGPQ